MASTQPSPSLVGSFNPQQMSDFLISNMLISKIGGITADTNFSFDVIFKLLLLLSMSEIKSYLTTFLTFISDQIKKLPTYFKKLYQLTINFIKTTNIFTKKNNDLTKNNSQIDEEILSDNNIFEIQLELDTNAMIGLYHYLQKNKNCKYNEKLNTVKIMNTREKIFNVHISSIEIELGDDKIIIENDLKYGFNIMTDEIINVDSTLIEKYKVINPNDVKKITDILDDEHSKIINYYKNTLLKKYKITVGVLSNQWVTSISDKFSELNIFDALKTKYPNIERQESIVEIIILMYLCKFSGMAPMTKILDQLKSEGKIFFDKNNRYDKDLACKHEKTFAYYNDYVDKNIYFVPITNTYDINYLKKIFLKFDDKNENNENNNNNNGEKKNYHLLNICIYTDKESKINNLIKKLLKKIDDHNKNENTEIKIFYLQILKENKITTITNPEYESWVETKELMDKIYDKESGESKNTENEKENIKKKKNNFKDNNFNFNDFKAPQKTIEKVSIEKKIITKQLNQTEKDIETLYLRKKDKDRLVSSLYQFKEKKQILKSMGLQNKLNILLYGMPGTGKSSTIQSIATYLQRNIYYLDLKEAETNQDLQMMFEYVNKNVQNGGIIVLEDIDAMTKVVLKRTEEIRESTTSELINNQDNKLSLEYLLNILQGTLTLDNSIFIVTTNHIEKLDPAFYRDGRFDVKIELKLCDHYQINSIYKKMIGRNLKEDILRKIKEDTFSPASIIFHVKNYIFSAETSDEEIMEPFVEF